MRDDGFDLDKLRSIGTIGRAPKSRTIEHREGSAIVRETEHADGRRDVALVPGTSRMKARRHRTGLKKGQVAEIVREGAK